MSTLSHLRILSAVTQNIRGLVLTKGMISRLLRVCRKNLKKQKMCGFRHRVLVLDHLRAKGVKLGQLNNKSAVILRETWAACCEIGN